MAADLTKPRRIGLTISPELEGQKVDTVLRSRLHLSGTVIRRIKWFDDGILLDGARVFTSHLVSAGQELSVLLSDKEHLSGIAPTAGPLDIRYEDEDIVVLNKQAGVPVHPIPACPTETLGNYLLHHYARTGQRCDFHPVHRLDKGTTGLMVVAKHPHAQTRLKDRLHTADFRREYLALTVGCPQARSGRVTAPIGPTEGSAIARQVREDGQYSCTNYEVLEEFGNFSLVKLRLETGRTHQIRVHMAHLGCPLVGDFLYGAEAPELIARPALHSAFLSFKHPISEETLTFEAELPEDMARLIGKKPT